MGSLARCTMHMSQGALDGTGTGLLFFVLLLLFDYTCFDFYKKTSLWASLKYHSAFTP